MGGSINNVFTKRCGDDDCFVEFNGTTILRDPSCSYVSDVTDRLNQEMSNSSPKGKFVTRDILRQAYDSACLTNSNAIETHDFDSICESLGLKESLHD